MNSSWRQSRKITFFILIIIIISGLLAYKIYPYFNKSATCFDGKENGDERGVDCGGSCKMICLTDVAALNVKYSKAISTDAGVYDLVSVIENKNKDKNTNDGSIDYTFIVYDKSGSVIKTVSGSTTLPIGQTFPIVIQNVPINLSSGNSISNVVLNISNNKSWRAENTVYANTFFKIGSTDFKRNFNNISQLKVNFSNLTKAYFRNVPVSVLLFDLDHNLIATNQTILKEIKGSESQELVFTWRNPISIDNPKVEVYPIVTPFTYIK